MSAGDDDDDRTGNQDRMDELLPRAAQPWPCRYQSQSDRMPLGSGGGRIVPFLPSYFALSCFSMKTVPVAVTEVQSSHRKHLLYQLQGFFFFCH